MINGLNPAQEQFLASIENLQARLNQAQNELSSGLRITKASDAPQAVGDIFQTRADLARVNQVEQNLNLVKAHVDAADTSLQSSVQLIQNAVVLGTQGATSTATANERTTLAGQVKGLLAQLVGLSRTQVDGVYIFGGDQSGSAPYQLDPTSATGVKRLVVTQATSQIADPAGVPFQAAKTAQDLFDKRDDSDGIAPENAFAALHNLQLALESNDTAAIAAAVTGLHTAGAYLNQQLAFYGAVQTRISSSIDLAKKFELQDQARLSAQQDADIPAAALELTQVTTGLNAAMAAQAKRPTATLFDYLR